MIQFYKPNSKVTGHACSFNFSEKDNCVYVNLIKQASWDDSSKRGTFGKNAKDPSKSCNLKLSSDEMCGIIHAIRTNSEFKIYHSVPKQKTMGNFKPYINKEGNQVGFGFSISKQPQSGDKSSFLVGFNFGESVKIESYFTYCLSKVFQILEKEQDAWKNKGDNTPKAKPSQPKAPDPKPDLETPDDDSGFDESDW